jgi:hypothetical protein
MNKENCTKGPARVIQAQRGTKYWGLSIVTGTAPDEQSGILADLSGHYRNEHTRADVLPGTDANAELIAEAFNVLTETGMTPRELADMVHEYREQLAAVRLTLYADLNQCGGNVQHHYTNHLKHREDLDRDAETGKFFPLSKYQPVTPA